MFTGLIDDVGTIDRVGDTPAGRELRIVCRYTDLAPGESIAVNGACLTVREYGPGWFTAAAVITTLGRTTIADWRAGTHVNLERSLRLGDRLGGHIVQGHVDATGLITAIEPEGEFYRLVVSYPASLAPFFIHKGSVAVDGISLTIADLQDDSFAIQIIPHTWTHTNLSAVRAGTRVNLECDLVGKYVMRAADLASRRVTA
jgi:riboflavin synthase